MQHIASYVEDDKDLENFRCSCPAVNNAIDESRGYFWRCRFIDRWEAPRVGSNVKSGADFKIAYRRRNHVLNKQTRFQLGDTRRERNCLEVLRDMILGKMIATPMEVMKCECLLTHMQTPILG